MPIQIKFTFDVTPRKSLCYGQTLMNSDRMVVEKHEHTVIKDCILVIDELHIRTACVCYR